MRFSRFRGGWRIGAGFFDAAEVAGDARGIVDHIADLANPGLDVGRIHPAILPFFEDTGSLDLMIRSHWRFPMSLAWRLGRRVMRRIGQFVLPRFEGRIATRVHALDHARDGRPDSRALVRSYRESPDPADDVMQVIAYATWERRGARYMSAAFPMPGGHVAGFLRLDAVAEDDTGKLAVELRSRRSRHGRDSGVWFVLGRLPIRVPLGESLALFAAGTSCVPPELRHDPLGGATIVGRHEQRLFGIRFVTHHYWFRPVAAASGASDRALPAKT